MKEFFLDTNIFLRFLIEPEGKQHQDCRRFFERLEKKEFKAVICSVILLEIYFTLKSFYQFSNRKCQGLLAKVLAIKNLRRLDKFDYQQALELFVKTGVKFSDCLIASLNFFKKDGVIVSYDRDFDKLGVRRVEPGEI